MGDSTAVGLGARYKEGIAYRSAQFLAKSHTVTLVNLGVPGATLSKITRDQAHKAVAEKADIILICAGANDVTHFSSLRSVKENTSSLLNLLKKSNPDVKILFTGSPAMGSVARFPRLTKLIAHVRTHQVNKAIQEAALQNSSRRLKIAEKTGPAFLRNPELFASDKFHPNSSGYATWVPVITEAL